MDPLVYQYESVSTTTTIDLRQSNRQWNKIRGISVEILELLNDCGGLSTIEIAHRLDKKQSYLRRYIYNLRNYGLIRLNQENWKWYISASDDIIIYIIYKSERRVKEERKKSERKDLLSPLNKKEKIESVEQKAKIPIDAWTQERTSLEVVVVSYLIEHFNETMNKFVLCTSHDEFAESVNVQFPESADIPKALIKLESDGVLYNVYLREKSCWKIGLKDAFINRVRFC